MENSTDLTEHILSIHENCVATRCEVDHVSEPDREKVRHLMVGLLELGRCQRHLKVKRVALIEIIYRMNTPKLTGMFVCNS